MPLSHAPSDGASPSAACVAAVLGDALHRMSVLGGREGMSRSLGSVYGGSVTRFLGGGCRGLESRVIATHDLRLYVNGVAVSVDGSTLLVSDVEGGSPSTSSVSSTARDGVSSAVVAMGHCSSYFHVRCGSHPTASCLSLTAATTA